MPVVGQRTVGSKEFEGIDVLCSRRPLSGEQSRLYACASPLVTLAVGAPFVRQLKAVASARLVDGYENLSADVVPWLKYAVSPLDIYTKVDLSRSCFLQFSNQTQSSASIARISVPNLLIKESIWHCSRVDAGLGFRRTNSMHRRKNSDSVFGPVVCTTKVVTS